ncbi:MAG TPA: chemotaxis-specific protein-glutamate methyltransferase CheB [Thermoanaerobaculia bacterium]|nr:chemotaxis-specific protein-glutamate methyltransferase CheB [Thermoanaerobaculia bacterium]
MSVIRVALADDSSFVRRAVAHLLSHEPEIQVVGLAADGQELLESLDVWNPDVIVLDLSMPGRNGIEILEAVRHRRPTPVIILSTHSRRGAPLTLEALSRGAADFIDKQEFSLVDFERLRQALVTKIRSVTGNPPLPSSPPPAPLPVLAVSQDGFAEPEAILLGASTGGPPAIEQTLHDLGADVEVPIVVAQHMPGSYIRAFAERLDKALPLAVRQAQDGMLLEGGTVTLAPGGMHLRIVREIRPRGLRAQLSTEPASIYQPSVDVLFCSAAEHLGAACAAVLLTGMGHDGAEGMLHLTRLGALTIAQNEATSVVFGMPRAAIEAGGAREVLPLSLIAHRLRQLLDNRRRSDNHESFWETAHGT